MRIWSLHPRYLDAKGLVALWREALLARQVLEGKTKGYKSHPQQLRFRNADNPDAAINCYLAGVYREPCSRQYRFNAEKMDRSCRHGKLKVTEGQIA